MPDYEPLSLSEDELDMLRSVAVSQDPNHELTIRLCQRIPAGEPSAHYGGLTLGFMEALELFRRHFPQDLQLSPEDSAKLEEFRKTFEVLIGNLAARSASLIQD